MKTLLIAAGEDDSLSLDQWNSRKDYWTGIGSFAIAFQGDVIKTSSATVEKIQTYDLIIGNLDRRTLPKLLKLQQARNPNTKWVSLIERCACDYLPTDPLTKAILDGSDLVNVINKHSLTFFRALTTARCEYIGIPYPAESIRARFKSTKRIQRIMLPPYVDPPGITHNASYLAAAGSGMPMYGAQNNLYNYSDADYLPFGYKEPLEYLTFEATSFAFMNLDHRYTWGRNVLDCAALGVPCIATRSTGHAEHLFPGLMVSDEFSILEANRLLQALITQPEFYERSANVPMKYFEEFTHEAIHKKIIDILWDSGN